MADASQFVAELQRANGALVGGPGSAGGDGGMAGGAVKADRGLRILRGGLVGLASQATGASGPVGRISQGLLLMGGGSTAVLGAAAGIGAVALAIRLMTADARENAQAQKELISELGKMGTHGQVTALRLQIDELRKLRDDPTGWQKASAVVKQFFQSIIGGPGATETGRIEAITREITRLENELRRLTDELANPWQAALRDSNQALTIAQVRFAMIGEPIAKMEQAVRVTALAFDPYLRQVAFTIASNERLARVLTITADAWRNAYTNLAEANIRMRMLGASTLDVNEALRTQQLINQGVDAQQAAQIAAMDKLAESRNRFAAKFREIFRDIDEELLDVGTQAGRSIVEGLMNGFLKMSDIFERFVKGWLTATLLGWIGNALSGLFGQGPSFGGTGFTRTGDVITKGQVSQSVMAPPQFSLTMGGGLPAPTTPFAVMRDAEWIRMLTGSIIVAKTQGFRP